MKYEIHFNSFKDYLTISLYEKFNLDSLESCYQEMLDWDMWKPGIDIIWDCRQCSLSGLDQKGLEDIGKMTAKYEKIRGPGRAAWVVEKDVDFGISRMFEMGTAENLIFNFHVFRSLEAAENWLSGTG